MVLHPPFNLLIALKACCDTLEKCKIHYSYCFIGVNFSPFVTGFLIVY